MPETGSRFPVLGSPGSSYPALCLQATSYAWRTRLRRIPPPVLSTATAIHTASSTPSPQKTLQLLQICKIAVFNFSRLDKWYACQNLSPEKQEMVLSRGMLGDHKGIPKIACPLHKKTFSLETGENLNADLDPIAVYPIKIEGENVYIGFSE